MKEKRYYKILNMLNPTFLISLMFVMMLKSRLLLTLSFNKT